MGNRPLGVDHLKKLQKYHDINDRFYMLTNQGVKFCEYVGVLKVGDMVIEVLPKTDGSADEESVWQQFLITMLRTSGMMNIEQTGFSSLKLKSNSILDLYMELFLNEVRYLMHTGLIKKYRNTEGNNSAMRGSLIFSKNIQHNLTHGERFYTRYSTYDKNNIFNRLLLKTTVLISRIGSPAICAEASGILLDFPECPDINVSDATFSKIVFDRKSEGYRKALNMSKLLLLNYHPDIQHGRNDVLALMFNMNELWEKYVFKMLSRELNKMYPMRYLVKEQVINQFWKPQGGYTRTVRPDIVVCSRQQSNITVAVLDTKWKKLVRNRPDDADLKQMLVYNLYNKAQNSALLYPANQQQNEVFGEYKADGHGGCSLMFLPLIKVRGEMKIQLNGILDFIEKCHSEMKPGPNISINNG